MLFVCIIKNIIAWETLNVILFISQCKTLFRTLNKTSMSIMHAFDDIVYNDKQIKFQVKLSTTIKKKVQIQVQTFIICI